LHIMIEDKFVRGLKYMLSSTVMIVKYSQWSLKALRPAAWVHLPFVGGNLHKNSVVWLPPMTVFSRYPKRLSTSWVKQYVMIQRKLNEEQRRYDVFRAKGYQIGSGAGEGACKYVVGKRLKQSGMIWTRAGSSAVLALRISWLNREWNKLWATKPLDA